MPSRRLHRAVAGRIPGVDSSGAVDRILDSTAATHGPSHRQDHVHTIPGVAVELARRGELTSEKMAAAVTHLALDRAWSALWHRVPMPSRLKQPFKQLGEEILALHLEAAARRRR